MACVASFPTSLPTSHCKDVNTESLPKGGEAFVAQLSEFIGEDQETEQRIEWIIKYLTSIQQTQDGCKGKAVAYPRCVTEGDMAVVLRGHKKLSGSSRGDKEERTMARSEMQGETVVAAVNGHEDGQAVANGDEAAAAILLRSSRGVNDTVTAGPSRKVALKVQSLSRAERLKSRSSVRIEDSARSESSIEDLAPAAQTQLCDASSSDVSNFFGSAPGEAHSPCDTAEASTSDMEEAPSRKRKRITDMSSTSQLSVAPASPSMLATFIVEDMDHPSFDRLAELRGSAPSEHVDLVDHGSERSLLTRCGMAYGEAKDAKVKSAWAHVHRLQRIMHFHRTFVQLSDDIKAEGTAWQTVKEWCKNMGIKLGVQGQGKMTYVWQWLIHFTCSSESLSTEKGRIKAKHALRDDVFAGNRLAVMAGAFGEGVLYLLPSNTCSTFKRWGSNDTFAELVRETAEANPGIRIACDRILHHFRRAGYISDTFEQTDHNASLEDLSPAQRTLVYSIEEFLQSSFSLDAVHPATCAAQESLLDSANSDRLM